MNAAWSHPPTTTEQLLHVEKYRRHELPVRLPPWKPPPAGFILRARRTLGELHVGHWLGAIVGREEGARLASGWGNGAAELFSGDAGPALRVRVRWDERDARHAKDAYDALVDAYRPGARAMTRAASRTCIERESVGPLLLDWSRAELRVHAASRGDCQEILRFASGGAAPR